jgi:hypothetical protein
VWSSFIDCGTDSKYPETFARLRGERFRSLCTRSEGFALRIAAKQCGLEVIEFDRVHGLECVGGNLVRPFEAKEILFVRIGVNALIVPDSMPHALPPPTARLPVSNLSCQTAMFIAIAAIALFVGTAWYLLKDSSSVASTKNRLTASPISPASSAPAPFNRPGQQSKPANHKGPKVTFYFASQRGTAEEYAESLAKEGCLRKFNSQPLDLEFFRFCCFLSKTCLHVQIVIEPVPALSI